MFTCSWMASVRPYNVYLLLDGFGICLSEEVEKCAAKVVRVTVGVAQLIGDGV